MTRRPPISDVHRADARLIWGYHQMGHTARPVSAGIGLGSHDLGVAAFAARLYHERLFPLLVFTGANSPTTRDRFPRGEAVHFAEHAIDLGVPESAIIIEPTATNTGQNIDRSRTALAAANVAVDSVLLISKPYMERRAYATARKLWSEVETLCASEPLTFDGYLKSIGDDRLVIDMLVGDLQRIIEYPALGYAIPQQVPAQVEAAYHRLIDADYTTRLLPTALNARR
ncbi:YdcF family protein [Actinomadura atramentaria]|uniref:YdcF family protein n=1 Tax=Actinomadura atramentaria TaxID=1990 RepID=UPI0003703093|nr:YdcF family protein [Actinomadura atramentaria]